jgi:hypothetical protein
MDHHAALKMRSENNSLQRTRSPHFRQIKHCDSSVCVRRDSLAAWTTSQNKSQSKPDNDGNETEDHCSL